MPTTICTSHANEVIVVDDALDPGGGAVVVLGLINQDGSDTFPGRTLSPDQAEELAASLAVSAATARSSAGVAAPPLESEQAYRDTLIRVRAAVPLAEGDQPRGTVPSPQAAAHAPSPPPVAMPVDRDELPIVGYDDLSAAVIVKQLSGLSAAELSAVLAHEQAHRNRKTICQRIAALHASSTHAAPPVD